MASNRPRRAFLGLSVPDENGPTCLGFDIYQESVASRDPATGPCDKAHAEHNSIISLYRFATKNVFTSTSFDKLTQKSTTSVVTFDGNVWDMKSDLTATMSLEDEGRTLGGFVSADANQFVYDHSEWEYTQEGYDGYQLWRKVLNDERYFNVDGELLPE